MEVQFSSKQKSEEFESRVLDIARVTRVVAGGRRFRFRAVVVMGDKKGHVGIGIGKGIDVAAAVEKATRQAQKHLITVHITGTSIPHPVQAKFASSRVILKPRPRGRGLAAGGPARVICEKAGLTNISAKFLSRTHNKLNNAMATIEALKKLRGRTPLNQPQEEEFKEGAGSPDISLTEGE